MDKELFRHLRTELLCWRTIGYLAWMVVMAAEIFVFCAAFAAIGGAR